MMPTRVSSMLFTLVGVLMGFQLALGIKALWDMEVNGKNFKTTFEDRLIPLGQLKIVADRYAVQIVDTTHKVRSGAISPQEGLTNIQAARRDIGKQWQAYTSTYLTPRETALVGMANQRMAQADGAVNLLEQILLAKDQVRLNSFASQTLYPSIDPVSDKISELVSLQIEVATSEYQQANARISAAYRNTLILVLASIFIGIFFARHIVVGLLRQLGGEPAKVQQLAHKIAQGELGHAVHLKQGDQHSLTAAMARMRDNLKTMVGEIQHSVAAVTDSSGAIHHSIGQVKTASCNQADATSSIAAAVEQLSVSITEVATQADRAKDSGLRAGQAAESGFAEVEQVIDGFDVVSEGLDKLTEAQIEQEQLVGKVGEIVKNIHEIAEQTNMLALNAAIEAARAGEQGRGFAIVADEVRKLAERSSAATANIQATLEGQRSSSHNTTELVRSVQTRTHEQRAQAHHARDSIHHIHDANHQLKDAVTSIAEALANQREASQMIALEVEKVAQMSEENGNTIIRMGDTAERLNSLSSELRLVSARFQTS